MEYPANEKDSDFHRCFQHCIRNLRWGSPRTDFAPQHCYQFTPVQIQNLREAVQAQNMDQIKACMTELTHIYAVLPPDEENRRFHRYAIIQVIYDALPQNPDLEFTAKKLFRLLTVEDASFGNRMCEFLESLLMQNADRVNDFTDQILAYIQEHYLDYNLKVEQVADVFHVSRQTVKSATGKTYSDYISKLRFDRVCILLHETDLEIQEIVRQVGYSDTSNFIRKFKNLYGMLPRKFRQQK